MREAAVEEDRTDTRVRVEAELTIALESTAEVNYRLGFERQCLAEISQLASDEGSGKEVEFLASLRRAASSFVVRKGSQPLIFFII